MIRRWTWVAGLLAAVLWGAPAGAQKVELKSGPVELRLTGRMDFQFHTTSVELEDEPASTFESRRVRLSAALTIDDWITAMLEPDFARADLEVKQAWMQLGFHPAFNIRGGQWKKPFSMIRLASSTELPMIERPVVIRGLEETVLAGAPAGTITTFRGTPLLGEEQEILETLGYTGYDAGVAVLGRVGGLGYEVGMFNGTGQDEVDENDGKSLAGRATYTLPLSFPVTLGAGVSRRDHAVTVDGVTETEQGTAWEADLELGEPRTGLWLLGEYAQGSNLVDGDFRGAQAAVAYFIGTGSGRIRGVEPMFRWSFGDPDVDVDGDGGMLYTPGLTLQFFGRNRLMLNWDVYVPEADELETENAVRVQMQLYY